MGSFSVATFHSRYFFGNLKRASHSEYKVLTFRENVHIGDFLGKIRRAIKFKRLSADFQEQMNGDINYFVDINTKSRVYGYIGKYYAGNKWQ